MHNSFILQQYVCYTMILNMFQAACCSKHVEVRSVTYILLKNKGIVHYVGNLKKSILLLMTSSIHLNRKRIFIYLYMTGSISGGCYRLWIFGMN